MKLKVGSDEITLHVTSDAERRRARGLRRDDPRRRRSAGHAPPSLGRGLPRRARACWRSTSRTARGEVRRIAVTPGDVVHIPGGRPHTVRNESPFDARAYVTFVPGTEMEQFVRAVASRPQDVVALAAQPRHRVHRARCPSSVPRVETWGKEVVERAAELILAEIPAAQQPEPGKTARRSLGGRRLHLAPHPVPAARRAGAARAVAVRRARRATPTTSARRTTASARA